MEFKRWKVIYFDDPEDALPKSINVLADNEADARYLFNLSFDKEIVNILELKHENT